MSKPFSSLPTWAQVACIIAAVLIGLFTWRSCIALEERSTDEVLVEVESEASVVLQSLSDLEPDFATFESLEPSTVDCDEAAPLAPGDNVRAYLRYLVEIDDEPIRDHIERIDEALAEHGYVQAEPDLARGNWDPNENDERNLRPINIAYAHPDALIFPDVSFSGESGDNIELTFYSDCFRQL